VCVYMRFEVVVSSRVGGGRCATCAYGLVVGVCQLVSDGVQEALAAEMCPWAMWLLVRLLPAAAAAVAQQSGLVTRWVTSRVTHEAVLRLDTCWVHAYAVAPVQQTAINQCRSGFINIRTLA
jgi:hypothetical protein